MKKNRRKRTLQHDSFFYTYVRSRRNPYGIYGKVYFCEDEDIAFVIKIEDYDDGYMGAWGCVNMAHQLLVPFEYEKIYDFGRFLIGRNCLGFDLYNKKGQLLYKIGGLRKTPHKAYMLVYDEEKELFRISIRKMAISKALYKRFYVVENGLAFAQKPNEKVGLILFSKLKLPFEYYAIAVPQNGYTLGIIEASNNNNTQLYDCQLIKVRSQIKREDSIHTTSINLFTGKTIEEVNAYFENKEQFERDCNSIICYNERLRFSGESLRFFPFDTENVGEIKFDDYDYAAEENSHEREDDYNVWEHYSYEEAMYDALGGEMDAIWNID